MFQHKIAKGYANPVGQCVKEINGKKVKNLAHLVQILRDSTDEFLVFRFAEQATGKGGERSRSKSRRA